MVAYPTYPSPCTRAAFALHSFVWWVKKTMGDGRWEVGHGVGWEMENGKWVKDKGWVLVCARWVTGSVAGRGDDGDWQGGQEGTGRRDW